MFRFFFALIWMPQNTHSDKHFQEKIARASSYRLHGMAMGRYSDSEVNRRIHLLSCKTKSISLALRRCWMSRKNEFHLFISTQRKYRILLMLLFHFNFTIDNDGLRQHKLWHYHKIKYCSITFANSIHSCSKDTATSFYLLDINLTANKSNLKRCKIKPI